MTQDENLYFQNPGKLTNTVQNQPPFNKVLILIDTRLWEKSKVRILPLTAGVNLPAAYGPSMGQKPENG